MWQLMVGPHLRFLLISCVRNNKNIINFWFQVLLPFTRDTEVLKHFESSSATPPKSYIRGTKPFYYILLQEHVAKSREFDNTNTIKVTFIERSPLLSGHSHLSTVINLTFHCLETLLNGQWKVALAALRQYIIKF